MIDHLIINLPRDVDRRRRMEAEVARSPLGEAKFFDAFDASAMTDSELAAAFDYRRAARVEPNPPTRGEVGCTLSHHAVWQHIARTDRPLIIMEDDVCFSGSWDGLLKAAERLVDTDRPRVVTMARHFFYRRSAQYDGFTLALDPRICYGNEFYIMNPAAARLLISLGRPHYLADHWAYFRRCGVELIGLLPNPVLVDDGGSSSIGQHGLGRIDRDGMRRSALPDIYLFDQPVMLLHLALTRLGLLRRHTDPNLR